MRRTFSLLSLLALAAPLAAQSPSLAWDLAAGSGDGAMSASVGVVRRHGVLPGGRLLLGYGARATWAGGDLKMTAAGAKNVPAGVVDTLRVGSTRVVMLNVAAHVGVKLSGSLEAGMNIDIAGVGTGGTTDATYRASSTAAPTTERASPSAANLFLYGSKDRGSLNSEFYAAWRLSGRWTLRGGLSHLLTEYKTERALTSNTDRFRRYSDLVFVAVRCSR